MLSKPTISWIIAGMIIVHAPTAIAYSPSTHANLTEAAITRSLLFDADLLESQQWGFQNLVEDPIAFPVDGPSTSVLSVIDLARRGAELEDGGTRAVNHFYDPQNDRGLEAGIAQASPDWILDGSWDNGFSTREAYSYLEDALLGEITDPTPPSRDVSWGKVFRYLGHLSHHMQDMAQPQHVRNDEHCDIALCKVLGRYGPSAYESETHDLRNDIETDGYPVVHLPRGRDYWSDATKTMGIAQLTSTNFVSIDTNFRVDQQGNVITHPDFPQPSASSLSQTTVPANSIYPSIQSDAVFEFYGNSFIDPYTEEQVNNPYLTAASLLVSPEGGQAFTLNAVTRESARSILTPRAVGYSAGIIDYFFRAKLEIESFRQRPNGQISLVLKNISQNGDHTYALDGRFEVYVNNPSSGLERITTQYIYTPVEYGEEFFFFFDGAALASGPAVVIFRGETILSSDPQSVERATTGFRLSGLPEPLVITEAMGWKYLGTDKSDDGTTSYIGSAGELHYMIAGEEFDKPLSDSVYNGWIDKFGPGSTQTVLSYKRETWSTLVGPGNSMDKRHLYDTAPIDRWLVRIGGIVEAWNYSYYTGEITCNTSDYSFNCSNPLYDVTPTATINLIPYLTLHDLTEGEEFSADTFHSVGLVPSERVEGLTLQEIENRYASDWAVRTLYFKPTKPGFFHLDN